VSIISIGDDSSDEESESYAELHNMICDEVPVLLTIFWDDTLGGVSTHIDITARLDKLRIFF